VLCKTVTLRLSAKGREIIMINAKKIEEIAKQVTESIPPSLKNMANDFEDKAKTVLQNKLAQLDVVTREEFDIQTQVLIKTRAKLTELESKLAELEAKISGNEPD
jgi:hypothetical protein